MKKLTTLKNWAAACGGVLLLAGCGGPSTSGGGSSGNGKAHFTLGFSQIGAESAWRTANTQSIKDAAKDAGITLKFDDAQQKQENQIRAIRGYIAEGVDVIAFSPVVETGWKPVLEEAKRANIPVIVSDRRPDVGPDLYATFIGSDFIQEGQRAGEWLAKKMNGKAVIAEITGTPGSAPANDRHKGFMEAISKYPGMKVVFSQTGNFTRAEGKQVMEALLKSDTGKQINVLFTHNDDMGVGAIQAITEAGKQPGKDIVIVSVDGIKDYVQLITEGKANCTIECNPLIGPLIMKTAADLLAHKKIPQRIVTPDEQFDETNAVAKLPERKY